MIDLPQGMRPAEEADAPVLARLINYAGEGMPLYLWSKMAGPGEDPWAIGAARQREKVRSAEIVAVDHGTGILAALTGYRIGMEPEAIEEDTPSMFVPLIELENMVPGSWYVNVLAALPEARGQGHGSRLLAVADALGRASGAGEMSLIVADNNTGARRLYERTGYAEIARRPMRDNGWKKTGTDWVLLAKPLAG